MRKVSVSNPKPRRAPARVNSCDVVGWSSCMMVQRLSIKWHIVVLDMTIMCIVALVGLVIRYCAIWGVKGGRFDDSVKSIKCRMECGAYGATGLLGYWDVQVSMCMLCAVCVCCEVVFVCFSFVY